MKMSHYNDKNTINVNTAVVAGVALLSAAIIIMIVVFAVMNTFSGKEEAGSQVQEQDGYIQYGGYNVPRYDNVPINNYDTQQFVRSENGRMTYPDATAGIDVSEFQGDIDWNAVKADGIEWASIRIGRRGYTEGGIAPDAKYAVNAAGAQQAGMEYGVYFFSQSITVEEAREEAQYVLDTLSGAKLAGPVVYDWEDINKEEARTINVDTATLCAMANEFCSVISAAGYKTEVYFNTYTGYSRYDVSQLKTDAFWLASYGDTPNFYYDFERWQYTHEGTVNGISTHVDMNLKLK